MLSDFNTTLTLIKRAAVEAVDATKPSTICFGKVISASPLQIRVEQKLTLGMNQLVLSRNVTDFDIDLTVGHATQDYSHTHQIEDTYSGGGEASVDTHKHDYTGRKMFTVHGALLVGEHVLLLRMQGGQKYIVLDRLAL